MASPSSAVAGATAAAAATATNQSFASLFRSSKFAAISYPVAVLSMDSPFTDVPSNISSTYKNRQHDRSRPKPPPRVNAPAPPPTPLAQTIQSKFSPNHLQQHVITATADQRASGQWGLKHSLPTDLTHPYTVVVSIDSGDRKMCIFKSASDQVDALTRWKKLFGPSTSLPYLQRIAFQTERDLREAKLAKQASKMFAAQSGKETADAGATTTTSKLTQSSNTKDSVKKVVIPGRHESGMVTPMELGKLSQDQWNYLLGQAKALGKEWRVARREKIRSTRESVAYRPTSIAPMNYKDFLNTYIDVQDTEAFTSDVAAPHPVMYTTLEANQAKGRRVIGRVLNTAFGGLAVGIYGFVGFLPKTEIGASSSGAGMSAYQNGLDQKVTEMAVYASQRERREILLHVRLAEHDAIGRPRVVVSMMSNDQKNNMRFAPKMMPTMSIRNFQPPTEVGGSVGRAEIRDFLQSAPAIRPKLARLPPRPLSAAGTSGNDAAGSSRRTLSMIDDMMSQEGKKK